MAHSPDRMDAALALSRFGLGARQGDIDAIASDPRGAVKEEIASRVVPSPLGDELRPTAELLTEFYAFQAAQKEMRERKIAGASIASSPNAAQSPIGGDQSGKADAMAAPSAMEGARASAPRRRPSRLR